MKPLRIIGSSTLLLAAGLGFAGTASADTTVTPAPVTFVDTCGTDSDTYIIPNTQGVGYYVDGVKLNPGVRNVPKDSQYVQVFTVAEPGYQLSAPATWDHQFDATTGCAAKPTASATPSSTAKPSPSSSSTSSTSAAVPVPSSTPSSSTTPAPTATSVVVPDESQNTQPAESAPAPTTSASSLPHTGADVAAPLAAAGILGGGGAVVLGGVGLRSRRRRD